MSIQTGMMVGGQGEQAIGDVSNALEQSKAARLKGSFQEALSQQNARLAQLGSQAAIQSGDAKATAVGLRAAAITGQERSSYGAQGVDVNSGSAADVQNDTAKMSALDEMTIRNNARMQAMGMQVEALNDTTQGRLASIAGRETAGQTLATGGAQVARAMLYGGYYLSKDGTPVTPPGGFRVPSPPQYSGQDADEGMFDR